MFTLSIALLALAVVFGLFGLLGVAGTSAVVGSAVLFAMAAGSMLVYWRRRPQTA